MTEFTMGEYVMSDRDLLIRVVTSVEHIEKNNSAMHLEITKEMGALRELMEQKNDATKDIALRAHRRIDSHEERFGIHSGQLEILSKATGQRAIRAWQWLGAVSGGALVTLIISAASRVIWR